MHESLIYGLREAVVAVLKSMVEDGRLPGIAPTSVIHRPLPNAQGFKSVPAAGEMSLPGILVYTGNRETIAVATNESRDFGYPVGIAVFTNPKLELESSADDDDRFLGWREAISHQFDPQRFLVYDPQTDGVPTDFHDLQIEPGPILDWTRWQQDSLYAGGLTLRFFTRRLGAHSAGN